MFFLLFKHSIIFSSNCVASFHIPLGYSACPKVELFLRTFLWFLHMPRPFPGTDQEDATRLQVHGTFFPITLGMR